MKAIVNGIELEGTQEEIMFVINKIDKPTPPHADEKKNLVDTPPSFIPSKKIIPSKKTIGFNYNRLSKEVIQHRLTQMHQMVLQGENRNQAIKKVWGETKSKYYKLYKKWLKTNGEAEPPYTPKRQPKNIDQELSQMHELVLRGVSRHKAIKKVFKRQEGDVYAKYDRWLEKNSMPPTPVFDRTKHMKKMGDICTKNRKKRLLLNESYKGNLPSDLLAQQTDHQIKKQKKERIPERSKYYFNSVPSQHQDLLYQVLQNVVGTNGSLTWENEGRMIGLELRNDWFSFLYELVDHTGFVSDYFSVPNTFTINFNHTGRVKYEAKK